MKRNPNWTRDELILALDLYFRAGRKQIRPSEPEVIQLSKLLNQLLFHKNEDRDFDFRNPQGVSMKLGNFLAIDPDYPGVGLKQGSKLDLVIWEDFASDVERLRATAATITNSIHKIAENRVVYSIKPEDNDEIFPEGELLTRLHKQKERNRKIVEKKKQQALHQTGKLSCEVCDFDFFQVYGKLGFGFAECHHIVPLSISTPGSNIRLTDLAIVCANCHRMIHYSRPAMLSILELRALVIENR